MSALSCRPGRPCTPPFPCNWAASLTGHLKRSANQLVALLSIRLTRRDWHAAKRYRPKLSNSSAHVIFNTFGHHKATVFRFQETQLAINATT